MESVLSVKKDLHSYLFLKAKTVFKHVPSILLQNMILKYAQNALMAAVFVLLGYATNANSHHLFYLREIV